MNDSDINVSPVPTKNKKTIEIDNKDIVRGSVEGVIIADNIAEEITTSLQLESIFWVVTIPKDPKINCNTGNWNAKAVLDINSKTKSKYFPMDQIGSTISAPNFIKKLIAAGTNIHHENNNPKKNNMPDAKKAGKIKLFSFTVRPGETNKITWYKI